MNVNLRSKSSNLRDEQSKRKDEIQKSLKEMNVQVRAQISCCGLMLAKVHNETSELRRNCQEENCQEPQHKRFKSLTHHTLIRVTHINDAPWSAEKCRFLSSP